MSTSLRARAVLALAFAAIVLPGAARAAPPDNDAFASASSMASLSFSDSVDTAEASLEGGEPSGWCWPLGGSIWYRLQPAEDTVVQINTSASFDRVVNVYRETGSGISGLAPVACGYSWSSTFAHLTAGETYFIQAGHTPWTSGGSLTLSVQLIPPPPNDDFAAAIELGAGSSDSQSSLAASREEGEPQPSCYPSTSNSHWYAFTPSSGGSFTARTQSGTWAVIGLYRGSSLDTLTELDCRSGGGALLTFHADAGQTTYIQVSDVYAGNYGVITTSVDLAPVPVAGFSYWPFAPSIFDTVSFNGTSHDPGGNPIIQELYEFGDGTSAVGCCPQYIGGQPDAEHRYAKDGDYTLRLTATTSDGRSASYEQVVRVRTHDVAITKLLTPQSAAAGQTKIITVGVSNQRYGESVRVDLYRSSPGGYTLVGSLTQSVPAQKGKTTDFRINYTFTGADASLGKVTFKAVATILGLNDALPADNEMIGSPTKMMR